MFVKFKTLFAVFYYSFLTTTVSYAQIEYGNSDNDVLFKNDIKCGEGASKGICKVVTECPVAKTAILNRKFHGLSRCGFQGITEIVCCPEEEEPQTDSRTPILMSKSATDDIKCGEGASKGICKVVTECPVAKTAILNRKFHGLSRCGFQGITEIVCCPEEEEPQTDSRTPILMSKSATACSEYGKGLPPDITFQILGGDNVSLGEFPHMAALGYLYDEQEGYKWECGASLISKKFVLTAAHCIVKVDGVFPTKVRLGIIDTTGKDKVEPLDINVKNRFVNPQYQPRQKRNDIALLELETEIVTSKYVQPACLYQKNYDPIGLVVTGWGLTSQSGDPSAILQKAILEPVPVSNCTLYYEARSSRPILNTQMCAMSSDGKRDTCSGDSGGPLQIQEEPSSIYTIVGITSYGIGCGGRTPGVYARVSSYLDWIESKVWP